MNPLPASPTAPTDKSVGRGRALDLPHRARVRLLGDCYLYGSAGLHSHGCRYAVSLLWATGTAPLVVTTACSRHIGRLLLVPPMLVSTLHAEGVPFVLVGIEPNHPRYPALAKAVPGHEVVTLDTAAHGSLREAVEGFAAGRLAGHALDARVRHGIEAMAAHWPDPGVLDPRVRSMMAELDRHPSRTLTELSLPLRLSPSGASRLFSNQLGLPLRLYALSRKIHAAAAYIGSGKPLTEVAQIAGFVDSAHFAKVWARCYGGPPSAYFSRSQIAMDNDGLPDWADWTRARHAATLAAGEAFSP
jgi:AraC-like DNA-binding protein